MPCNALLLTPLAQPVTNELGSVVRAQLRGAAMTVNFLEHGIAPVGLVEVALAARQPVITIACHFPTGKLALVVVIKRYLAGFRQQLVEHGPQNSNAVKELPRARQVLQALPREMRSLSL